MAAISTDTTTTTYYNDAGNNCICIRSRDDEIVIEKYRPRFSEFAPGWNLIIYHVRKLVSVLLCRNVDRHAGGYQRQRRHAWSGRNFRRENVTL